MNKLIIALAVGTPILLLSSCTISTRTGLDSVVYNPGYSNDYVYSVGYYNNRPYWGNNYYYVGAPGYVNTIWGRNGYWGGGYYNGY